MRYFVMTIAGLMMSTLFINCSGDNFSLLNGVSSTGVTIANNTLTIVGNEVNVVPITVGCNYINQPCVSVTICKPGTATCVTVNNILLDTGSYGLRVFNTNVTSLALSAVTDGSGNTITECVGYLDGTSHWGPVKSADVKLGGLTASSVPIQVLDASYPTSGVASANCTSPEASSTDYNGILGVGLFADDCGSGCTVSGNRLYFACTGTACSSAGVAVAKQVTNPVAMMPAGYNNGVALQLPGVTDAGATTASGYMVLGIATAANNTPPTTPYFFKANSSANFKATYNGTTYNSFIDSGSNGNFTPQITTALVNCNDWWCPTTQKSFTVTQNGIAGTAQVYATYNVANASTLFASNGMVFNNLGGYIGPTSYFDFGLPFFLGRTIFVGIDGKTSSFGTGPYWAY